MTEIPSGMTCCTDDPSQIVVVAISIAGVAFPPTVIVRNKKLHFHLVSTSGNSATFSKSGGGGEDVYVKIIVNDRAVATNYFFMGGSPDISDISVNTGCTGGYHYGQIPLSSTYALNRGVDEFEWRGTVPEVTIEPHPVGYIDLPGDIVRIVLKSGYCGGVKVRAHNTCGWGNWRWVTALLPCSSTYSMTASPNPVSTMLNINITPDEEAMQSQSSQSQSRTSPAKSKAAPVYEIKLFNNAGSRVFQTTAQDAGSIAVNVSALPNGVH